MCYTTLINHTMFKNTLYENMSLTSHNSPFIFQDLSYMTIEYRIVSEIYLERLEIKKELTTFTQKFGLWPNYFVKHFTTPYCR